MAHTCNEKAVISMQKALFIDRDGIINIDHGYIYRIEDFEFTDGIIELLQTFAAQGYLLLVVTNQSGIGRGYYTEADFAKLTQWMLATLHAKGVAIAQVYYCPHAPNEDCQCRKPNIGMITQALSEFDIDIAQSWMIGDKPSDIKMAINAKMQQHIYIGQTPLLDATYSFTSVKDAATYFAHHSLGGK